MRITLRSGGYDFLDRIIVRGRFTELKRHSDNKFVGFKNIFDAEPAYINIMSIIAVVSKK